MDRSGINVLRIKTAKIKSRNAWDKIPPLVFTDEGDEKENPSEALDLSKLTALQQRAADVDMRLAEFKSNLLPSDEIDLIVNLKIQIFAFPFRDVKIEEKYALEVQFHLEKIRSFFESNVPGYATGKASIEALKGIYERIFYGRCRVYLYRACKYAFEKEDGRIYSFYDTRSTFAANRKTMQGLERTADEMGHNNVFTTQRNYAGKKSAWTQYIEYGSGSYAPSLHTPQSSQAFLAKPQA